MDWQVSLHHRQRLQDPMFCLVNLIPVVFPFGRLRVLIILNRKQLFVGLFAVPYFTDGGLKIVFAA